MGMMVIVYKVYADLEKLDSIVASLNTVKSAEPREVRREPVGFGIEVIKVAYVLPDKVEGLVEKLEAEVRAIDGINEVEVEAMTLL